ncbi:MAG: hypothetical protein AAGF30_13735 [Pseudomonadota bacterium]
MAGPLSRLGLLLLLLATPATAQISIPAALDAAIATCTRLIADAEDAPPPTWAFRGSHPIPAVGGTASGTVREWHHPTLDMTLQKAHWPDTGSRTCTLGPDVPALEPRSLDGRATIPVTAIRAAVTRWRAADAELRLRPVFGWIDGRSLDCNAAGGLGVSHVTSDRHLGRYQFWMIHQESGPGTREACAVP